MPAWIRRLPRRLALGAAMLLVALLVLRIWDSQRGPPLSPWHLVVPEELSAKALDAADWPGYLAAEDAAFATVRHKVTEALEPQDGLYTLITRGGEGDAFEVVGTVAAVHPSDDHDAGTRHPRHAAAKSPDPRRFPAHATNGFRCEYAARHRETANRRGS